MDFLIIKIIMAIVHTQDNSIPVVRPNLVFTVAD